MTLDPAQLLAQLGSGVRPASSHDTQQRPSGVEHGAFAELLKLASEGGVASGLPVTIKRGADIELSDEQLKELAYAADRAERNGVTHAMVMLDGQRYVMDVHQRQIVGTAQELSDKGLLTRIDGVIDLDCCEQSGQQENATVAGPGTGVAGGGGSNPSLLEILARVGTRVAGVML